MDALDKKKGATYPEKARLYRFVKEHGAQSILGRPLTPREAIEMQTITRLEGAYYAKQAATNEAAWANQDPGGLQLIAWAIKVQQRG